MSVTTSDSRKDNENPIRLIGSSIVRNKSQLITLILLSSFTIFGFVLISLYSNKLESSGTRAFAVLALCAVACLAIGALTGFLFGIPRVLQSDSSLARFNEERKFVEIGQEVSKGTESQDTYRHQVNTNLEQISDWITKIFVGIGLIQFQSIPDLLNRSSAFIANAFTEAHDAQVFAAALIIYCLISGFLTGYILTRLFLQIQFRRSDLKSSRSLPK